MMILADGTRSLIARQASMPERFGIRTSSRTTSGATLSARVVPSTPSPASPTTSMPSSLLSSMVRPRRNSSWSSTTSTRIGSLVSTALVVTSRIMPRRDHPSRASGAGQAWGSRSSEITP